MRYIIGFGLVMFFLSALVSVARADGGYSPYGGATDKQVTFTSNPGFNLGQCDLNKCLLLGAVAPAPESTAAPFPVCAFLGQQNCTPNPYATQNPPPQQLGPNPGDCGYAGALGWICNPPASKLIIPPGSCFYLPTMTPCNQQ